MTVGINDTPPHKNKVTLDYQSPMSPYIFINILI